MIPVGNNATEVDVLKPFVLKRTPFTGRLTEQYDEMITRTDDPDQQLYSNIRITSTGQLTVLSDVELMGNSRVIVEAGGELIVDGGTLSNVELELKAGSSLQIINGGIIETRSGFEAPLGASFETRNEGCEL
jgi:hypothetical protein